jgi:hypothetical protein
LKSGLIYFLFFYFIFLFSFRLDVGSACLSTLSPHIGLLTTLTVLCVDNNELCDLPNELSSLTKLEVLELYGNKFKTIPGVVGTLVGLQRLYARKNDLRDLNLSALSRCKKLHTLKVTENASLSFALCRDIVENHNAVQEFLSGVCCASCGKHTKKNTCSRCRNAVYCDNKCQNADWQRHKKFCWQQHKNEVGPCCLLSLAEAGYTMEDLRALESCREMLRAAKHVAPVVVVAPDACQQFSAELPEFVKEGSIRCSSEGRLVTSGVSKSVVLIIFGQCKGGEPRFLMQHLSRSNFQGGSSAGVCPELKTYLGETFVFKSGFIIQGELLNDELICEVDAPRDPSLQQMLWDELKSFSWRSSLEMVSTVGGSYSIVAIAPNLLHFFAERLLVDLRAKLQE